MKILVVDDEPVVRLSIKRAAQRKGHEVIEAEDGLLGVKVWREAHPDVVFLDVLMPGLSGPQVLKQINGKPPSKVILISAYSGDYSIEKAKSLGADLFISKPFDDIFNLIDLCRGVIQWLMLMMEFLSKR